MENVQFEEDLVARPFNSNRDKKMSVLTRLLIKIGLAKDQKQANTVMLIISAISLLIMSYVIISTFFPNILNFNKSKTPTTTSTNPWETNAPIKK